MLQVSSLRRKGSESKDGLIVDFLEDVSKSEYLMSCPFRLIFGMQNLITRHGLHDLFHFPTVSCNLLPTWQDAPYGSYAQESVASDFMKELESGDVPDVPVSYDQFGPATRDELPA